MKYIKFVFPMILLIFGCKQESARVDAMASDASEITSNELVGTWRMVSYKYGEDSFFIDVPSILYYRKHITPTHYSVVSYDEDGDNIFKSIGGTYESNNNEYIETIQYFYPPGSDLQGSSVKFSSKIDGNRWHIEGYFKSMHFNPKTVEYVQIDSTHIEEVWERM